MLKFYKSLLLIAISITSVYSSEKHNIFKVITNNNINNLSDTKQFLQRKRHKPISNKKINKVNSHTLEYNALYTVLNKQTGVNKQKIGKFLNDINSSELNGTQQLKQGLSDIGIKEDTAKELLECKSFMNNLKKYKNGDVTINYRRKIRGVLKLLLTNDQIRKITCDIRKDTKIDNILNEEYLKKNIGIEKKETIDKIINNQKLRYNMKQYAQYSQVRKNVGTLEYGRLYNILKKEKGVNRQKIGEFLTDVKNGKLNGGQQLKQGLLFIGIQENVAEGLLNDQKFKTNLTRYKNGDVTIDYYYKIHSNLQLLPQSQTKKITDAIRKNNEIDNILNEEYLKKTVGIEQKETITNIINNTKLRENMKGYKTYLENRKSNNKLLKNKQKSNKDNVNNNIHNGANNTEEVITEVNKNISKINKQGDSNNKSNSSINNNIGNNNNNNINVVEQNNINGILKNNEQ